MPLSEIFFLVLVFYLLYRFVFHFLLPIVRTTRHVRQQFRNMQGGADGQQGTQQGGHYQQGPNPQQGSRPTERHSSPKGPDEDYIDFEEVKSPKK